VSLNPTHLTISLSTTSDLKQKAHTTYTRTLVGIAPLTVLWLVLSFWLDLPARLFGQLFAWVIAP